MRDGVPRPLRIYTTCTREANARASVSYLCGRTVWLRVGAHDSGICWVTLNKHNGRKGSGRNLKGRPNSKCLASLTLEEWTTIIGAAHSIQNCEVDARNYTFHSRCALTRNVWKTHTHNTYNKRTWVCVVYWQKKSTPTPPLPPSQYHPQSAQKYTSNITLCQCTSGRERERANSHSHTKVFCPFHILLHFAKLLHSFSTAEVFGYMGLECAKKNPHTDTLACFHKVFSPTQKCSPPRN